MVSGEINKNILILGGSNGIGGEVTKLFLEKDVNIIILDIDKNGFDKKFNNNNKVKFINFDLADISKHKKVIIQIKKKFKTIHAIINFSRSGNRKSLESENIKNWDLTLNVNLRGTFFFLREIANIMKRQSFGNIVNISSVAGKFTTRESVPYHISKNGITILSKLFAKNYGKYGVKINSISPSFILQKRYQDKFNNKKNSKVKKILKFVNNVKNIGKSKDVFELINFLISSKSNFINGEDIMLDGGSNSINPDPVATLLDYEKL